MLPHSNTGFSRLHHVSEKCTIEPTIRCDKDTGTARKQKHKQGLSRTECDKQIGFNAYVNIYSDWLTGSEQMSGSEGAGMRDN